MRLKLKQLLIISIILFPAPSLAGYSLKEMACGAKICLSDDGGGLPCKPFKDKYYSYKVKKYGVVLKGPTKVAREKFLDLCKNKDGPAVENRRKALKQSR